MRQFFVSVSALVLCTAGVGLASEPVESLNEATVNQVTGQLLKAYQDADAAEFASLFTTEGEYVDIKGVVFHGRSAIEKEFTEFFREVPDSTMQIEFTSVRPIATGIIASECLTKFMHSPGSPKIPGRCQLVCTREGELWRIASLRELSAVTDVSPHHAKVSQLEWLVGEWIGEGAHSQVHFTCRWDDSGHYLLRDFMVETGAPNPLKGNQRIGYDPLTRQLKIWSFDSAGGHSEGFFEQDAETWIVRTTGVTTDGRLASSTSSLKRLDDHRIQSEVIDRFTAGERIVENETITLIRKPKRTLKRTSSLDISSNPDVNITLPEADTDRK